MAESLQIELASPTDLTGVLSLVTDCIKDMRAQGIEQWDEIYPDELTLRQDIQSETLYVLRWLGTIRACGVLNETEEPEWAEVPWTLNRTPIGAIHRLMVHPDLQGKGIARSFMKSLEARARQLGMKTIRLDAFTKNPRALALYESLGYLRAGLVPFRKGEFCCFEKEG